MIVNRKLAYDKQGNLLPAPKEVDLEVREIWQPWLKSRCNFVVRYIVPNRVNLMRILETEQRFRHEVKAL